MSTYFGEISDLILTEMSDSKFSNMDSLIAKQLLSNLIVTSATVEFHICNKIEKYSPYYTYEKRILNVGVKSSLEVQLDENPPDTSYDFFAMINDVYLDSSKIAYNQTSNKITVNSTINDGDIIVVGFEADGYFNDDLTHREKYIVALGAYVHYLQQFISSEKILRQEIGDKDYKLSSNWQTLNSILKVNEEKKGQLEKLIYDYLYDNTTYDMLT